MKRIFLFCAIALASIAFAKPNSQPNFPGSEKLKVYVMLGMHVDFYHSWRGDSPDEAGYGYDIRIIRGVLDTLDKANNQNKKAKAYWDFSASHWTLGEFIPQHAPDLIPRWQSRTGRDEFVVGPYNNGANSAGTKEEFQKSIEWTLRNPDGFGLEQIFPHVTKLYRPQENMLASNQLDWVREAGMYGLILHYSTWPFTAFSNFIPVLADSDRYNPLTIRTSPTEQPILVLPAMFPVDVVNDTSLANLLVKLRKKQLSGEIRRNLVVHINVDADAPTWLPLTKSKFLQDLVPNLGGLQEIVDTVNRFHWSDFTTPEEYLKLEQPQKEILVRQDMADGAYDGFYNWAERSFTQKYWSRIDESRRLEMALSSASPLSLFSFTDEAFRNRVLALSTTHFGMSTPFVNQQRLARVDGYTRKTLDIREAEFKSAIQSQIHNASEQQIVLVDFPRLGENAVSASPMMFQKKFKVKKGMRPEVLNARAAVTYEFANNIDDEFDSYNAYFVSKSVAQNPLLDMQTLKWNEVPAEPQKFENTNQVKISNNWLTLEVNDKGFKSLAFNNEKFGGEKFLSPFMSFAEGKTLDQAKNSRAGKVVVPKKYGLLYETLGSNIQSFSMATSLDLRTNQKTYKADLNYRFLLHKDLPYVFMNVKAALPNTLNEKLPDFASRTFLRHVDWRWKAIALANLEPQLGEGGYYKVWKSNFGNQLSDYEIDYEKFNSKNKKFDSFNNHLTPGWVAFSRGGKGILIATNTAVRSSMAFAPIRIRRQGKESILNINPFGSYYGDQLDYSHLGGEKLGTLIANAGAAVMMPNAPTFVGENLEMEMMIAPFAGEQPSEELIAAAKRFAYQPLALYTGDGIVSTEREYTGDLEVRRSLAIIDRLNQINEPIEAPESLAASPDNGGAILTWRKSADPRVHRQEVVYQSNKDHLWKSVVIGDSHSEYLELKGLVNGQKYAFGVRALGDQAYSGVSNWQFLKPTQKVGDGNPSVRPTLEMVWRLLDSILKYHAVVDPDPLSRIPAAITPY